MSAIRCAVVGLGLFGRHHAAILAGTRDVDLVLCIDTDPAQESACPPGARFATDLDALATRPQTPWWSHAWTRRIGPRWKRPSRREREFSARNPWH